MRRVFTPSFALCVILLPPSVGAEIVKCTDAEGNVTYSDAPCQRKEKRVVVDTRAASNVLDYSFIRSQKARVFAPVPAPVYSSSPSPPPPAPEPFVVDRSVKPATTY